MSPESAVLPGSPALPVVLDAAGPRARGLGCLRGFVVGQFGAWRPRPRSKGTPVPPTHRASADSSANRHAVETPFSGHAGTWAESVRHSMGGCIAGRSIAVNRPCPLPRKPATSATQGIRPGPGGRGTMGLKWRKPSRRGRGWADEKPQLQWIFESRLRPTDVHATRRRRPTGSRADALGGDARGPKKQHSPPCPPEAWPSRTTRNGTCRSAGNVSHAPHQPAGIAKASGPVRGSPQHRRHKTELLSRQGDGVRAWLAPLTG